MLQSTFGGYGLINQENVFKVCDQPHPLLVKTIVGDCLSLKIDEAYNGMRVPTYPSLPMSSPQPSASEACLAQTGFFATQVNICLSSSCRYVSRKPMCSQQKVVVSRLYTTHCCPHSATLAGNIGVPG